MYPMYSNDAYTGYMKKRFSILFLMLLPILVSSQDSLHELLHQHTTESTPYITVYKLQGIFEWKNNTYDIINTKGKITDSVHAFSLEQENSYVIEKNIQQ